MASRGHSLRLTSHRNRHTKLQPGALGAATTLPTATLSWLALPFQCIDFDDRPRIKATVTDLISIECRSPPAPGRETCLIPEHRGEMRLV